jgi:hypothetical protein
MRSHAVLSFFVRPVSISLKRVSEELARTDCIRWMFLVRGSNLARIQPTLWQSLRVQSNRTHLRRGIEAMQPQRIVRPLNGTAKDQLLEALFLRAARFQKAQAIRHLDAEPRSTSGQASAQKAV